MKNKRITLENHLRKIAECDETVKNLESVFNIQKQKVTRYISSVVTSFPTYSTHDAVHSMNIISAIEKILGEKTVKRLSGIDTFLILMCAYMHDTGMLYSDEEVKRPLGKEACDMASQGLACSGYGSGVVVTATIGMQMAAVAINRVVRGA